MDKIAVKVFIDLYKSESIFKLTPKINKIALRLPAFNKSFSLSSSIFPPPLYLFLSFVFSLSFIFHSFSRYSSIFFYIISVFHEFPLSLSLFRPCSLFLYLSLFLPTCSRRFTKLKMKLTGLRRSI